MGMFSKLTDRLNNKDESPRFSMYDALKQTAEERGELIQLRIDNKALLEALKERIGFYYERDVPHQSQHPHCQCRKCVDERVNSAIQTAQDTLDKYKD